MDYPTNLRRSGYGRSQMFRNPTGRTVGMQCCMQPDMSSNIPSNQASGSHMPSGSVNCPGSVTGPIESYPIGMGYVPMQQWQQTYSLEQGLFRGTIFPELDLPFLMGRCQ